MTAFNITHQKQKAINFANKYYKKAMFVKNERRNTGYTTKPAQAQGSRLPAMRHRSLNNFHKKWDNNKK